ncbi:MAG TPA: hypothetical protein PK600_06005 [Deltaproteobacteria bacterium]|nr:hypothetical protein [Deltaproteobacteria bacterium]
MDFRSTYCAWCELRTGRIEGCRPCPKYRRYGLGQDRPLDMQEFCGVCTNRESLELAVFCRMNRFHQADSGEDFECYRFCLDKAADAD